MIRTFDFGGHPRSPANAQTLNLGTKPAKSSNMQATELSAKNSEYSSGRKINKIINMIFVQEEERTTNGSDDGLYLGLF